MFDSLGDRMKTYEDAFRYVLPPRLPVIVRVDGKAFHQYTDGLDRPFCDKFSAAMDGVAGYLMSVVQGARLAYIQSDEINLLVHNYATHDTQPWVGGALQKFASITASVAGAVMTADSPSIFSGRIRLAYFDSRAFVVPEAEVTNYFLWRQNDASRNSIQMLARSLASHKECLNLGQSELQELCFQRGKNWNDLPTRYRRGRCLIREQYELDDNTIRHRHVVDNEIPIWKGEGREYVEKLLATETRLPMLDGEEKSNG